MPIQGRTWRNYVALVREVDRWASDHSGRMRLKVEPEPQSEEEELLKRFSEALKDEDPAALNILERLNISPSQYRYHLYYIAHWKKERRWLLANGGNFQLLESLKKQESKGLLQGLILKGTRAEQERALAEHLEMTMPTPEVRGWLAPVPNPGKPVREYGPREVVWVYPTAELQQADDLHPSVARSLIRRYLPKPGLVADPMAGSGTIARMAALMGHRAWASDIEPRAAYIAQHDIRRDPLDKFLIDSDGLPAEAELVFVHPPTPDELDLSGPAYYDWLMDVLHNCWNIVSCGGHVVLIVGIEEQMSQVARAEKALIHSAETTFEKDGMRQTPEQLTAQHLAAARDGRQGWHILVLQRPVLVSDQEE